MKAAKGGKGGKGKGEADYRKSLSLPKTDFPMKADLVKREPAFVKRWEETGLYRKMRGARNGSPKFILHDGPPYANGEIHMGHVLNRVLKDTVLRYKFMRGFDVPFVPGWDCHGQPIEHNFLKISGLAVHDIDPLELRRACADYAMKWVKFQREQFKRLGAVGDWEAPYLTMDKELEASEIECVGRLIQEGYITRGKKPVIWCPSCETALAENAVEYGPHKTDSVYVKFKVLEWPSSAPEFTQLKKPVYVVIWTTTPWTLPANVAIAFNARFKYDLLDTGTEILLMASDLAAGVMALAGIGRAETVATVEGRVLEGMKCEHPFVNHTSVGILADHVTLESGTGCVHTAPGHGEEDFQSGVEYRLPVISPVDGGGRFTADFPPLEGVPVLEADGKIISMLKEKKALLHAASIEHRYAFCWRCHNPIIFRATEQWFISLDHKALRRRTLEATKKAQWLPSWGRDQIGRMIETRPDWCISRQRSWGVPIPVFYCESCGHVLATEESLRAAREMVAKEGSDGWWIRDAASILSPETRCTSCGGRKLKKEMDTLDVWFDSGVTHTSVVKSNKDLSWPADLYLEGTDQYRGWYNSSMITSAALYDHAPFKQVVTHGIFLDAEGEKMSKSIGNVLSGNEALNKWGADMLRLWTLSENFHEDIRYSQEILQRVVEAYRKLRNTLRFLLGNLSDYQGAAVPREGWREVDRWMIWRTSVLVTEVTRDMDSYAFYRAIQRIYRFCTVELSSFYLDLAKDRMYVSHPEDAGRKAAQQVMAEVFSTLVRLLAPMVVFTAEDSWDFAPECLKEEVTSIHLANWPEVQAETGNDDETKSRWETFMELRDAVLKALEAARQKGDIANALESAVTLEAGGELEKFLKSLEKDLAEMLIVSQVRIKSLSKGEPAPETVAGSGLRIGVSRAEGKKCARCWLVRPCVGSDSAHPSLCGRCAKVIRRLKQDGD